ncbi:MAG: hypothetical protein EOS32_30935 [Mesorhizobium sp.]|nr:MAG: hypothetical protein EOS32_30935 [Mesorhizobium sp.]
MLTDQKVRCASVLENHAFRPGRARFQTGSALLVGVSSACAKGWEWLAGLFAIGRCGFMVKQS